MNWVATESLERKGEWRSGKATTITQEFKKLHNSQETTAHDHCLKIRREVNAFMLCVVF